MDNQIAKKVASMLLEVGAIKINAKRAIYMVIRLEITYLL